MTRGGGDAAAAQPGPPEFIAARRCVSPPVHAGAAQRAAGADRQAAGSGPTAMRVKTVWYDPLSSQPFVAKCMAAVSDDAPSRCLRAVYLGTGIAAVYDFEAQALGSWREFDRTMHERLGRIGAL